MIGNNTTSLMPRAPTVRLILYYIIAVVSVLGNALVLAVFIKNKSLRIPANYLIINLAITDIFNGLLKDGFNILGLLTHGKYQVGALCNFDGFIQILLYLVTSYTLTATAVLRYLVIVYSYGRKISTRIVILVIVAIWVYCIINSLLPIFGWIRFVYQPLEKVCLPDWTSKASASYLHYSLILNTIMPICVLGFCYINIYVYVKRSSKKFLKNVSSRTPKKLIGNYKSIRKEIALTKKLFFVYLAFVACYLPYNIVALILLPSGVYISPAIFFLIGFLINSNSAFNPFLYGIVYRSIRTAYRNFICSLCQKSGFTSKLIQVQSHMMTPLNTDRGSEVQSVSFGQTNRIRVI